MLFLKKRKEQRMVKFIHAADVHLGITYAGVGKSQNEIARELKQAAFDAFEKVIDTAIKEEVDALVLAGDLLDSSRTFVKEKCFLQSQLNRLAPFGIPVVFALGNHDAGSAYVSGKHIYTFGSAVETIEVETRNGERVAFSGFSYEVPVVATRKVQEYLAKSANCDFHIGVLHGELTTSQGRYAPFSIPELREKGYDYWALGHIHTCQKVSSQPCAWYSGTTQGADRKESGPKGALLVEITPGKTPVVHFIETSTMDWMEVELAISETAHLETLPYLILEALPSPSKRSLVTLHLQTQESLYSREDLKQVTEVVNGLLEEQRSLVTVMSIREQVTKPLRGASGISLVGDVDESLFSEMEIAKSGFAYQLMSDFLQKEDVQKEIHERALRLLETRFSGREEG